MPPRSIWKGAISFGLVTIPVKLFSATEEKDISFRQVHPEDGGRIKYKRVCEKCGREIPYAEIAKGYEMADGRMVRLRFAAWLGLKCGRCSRTNQTRWRSRRWPGRLLPDKAWPRR